MKNYTITVNGNVYDVTVEENGAGAPAAAPVAAPRAAAPAAPAAAPKAAAGAGSIQVKAGAAGKVFQVPTSVGQKVEAGDTVIIIEAMSSTISAFAEAVTGSLSEDIRNSNVSASSESFSSSRIALNAHL